MGAGISWMAVMMAILTTGGNTDVLHIVPTDAYWNSKNVTVSVETMLAELKAIASEPARSATDNPATQPANKAQEVCRLMAIRTLGELKAKEAAAALKALTESKEMFVAEYAQEALAAIDGKPSPKRAIDTAGMAKDLAMLPSNCGFVAQVSAMPGQAITIDSLLGGMGAGMDETAKANAKERMIQGVLAFVEQAGNVRLDGVTVGLSDTISNNSGFVIVIARGTYDAKALKGVLGPICEAHTLVDNVEFLDPGSDRSGVGTISMPSNDRFIFCVSPWEEREGLRTLIAKAVNTGKGTFAENAEMAKLIKSVDTTKPLWAAAKISDAYRRSPYFVGIDTVTLTADIKDNVLTANLLAAGQDAEALQAAMGAFNNDLAGAKQSLKRAADRAPAGIASMMETATAFLESIELKADGAKLTAAAQVKDFSKFMMLPSMMFVAIEKHPAPVTNHPVPPVNSDPN